MRGRAGRSQLLSAFGRLLIGEAVVAAVDLRVAVDQGWLVQHVVDATRLPRAVEQPDQDRVVTQEWAQIRLQLSGEGTVLLCDLALDCGLRYEEVIALRPMDVLDADARNASHLWIRQAITWPGRTYSGGDEPWLVGPTKGKRFRKVAVSAPVFHRLRLYIEVHGRQPRSLVFDYPLLRAEHAQAREGRPAPARFPTGRYITPGNGRTGQHGKAHTYALGCRCPYCRNANTEARFRARRAKGAQPAAPWLDPAYLADRGDAVDPVKYHWFSRYAFGAAVRRAEIGWTPTFHDLRHGMVSWAYDAGASPAVVQRDAGHANLHTTQGYMHVVDKVVGSERLAAMKVMYDRVDAASAAPVAAEPPLSPTALEQLSAVVLSNASLSAADKAALLLELARQTTAPDPGPHA